MKCAKDYLGVKVAQSNINLDLSIKNGHRIQSDLKIFY